MSKREEKLSIEDIFHSIQKIETYTKDMLFVDFEEDEKIVDAVVRNQTYGEFHVPMAIIVLYFV